MAAWPGGSSDIPESHDRVAQYTAKIRALGVEIVDTIPALLDKVDVVLVESIDGRPHLEQALAAIEARKPLFIDKPVAGSLADAIKIFEAADKFGVPCFSSSTLRFGEDISAALRPERVGKVLGCETHGPCSIEPHHPDLFWYGIHGVELLFTAMGTGCESVIRVHSEGTDMVIGTWKGGRIGSFRGIRQGPYHFGAKIYGSKTLIDAGGFGGYEPLVVEIVKFFKTGKPPVSAAQTLEIYAFMEAADESKRQGGTPVKIVDVMSKARNRGAAK